MCLRSSGLSFEEASGGKGASLQNYNNELVKCIDDLREKREEVNRQILASEEEKAKIQKDLSILTERLQKINENLVRKTQARNEYDKTIQETEAAYMKVRVGARGMEGVGCSSMSGTVYAWPPMLGLRGRGRGRSVRVACLLLPQLVASNASRLSRFA